MTVTPDVSDHDIEDETPSFDAVLEATERTRRARRARATEANAPGARPTGRGGRGDGSSETG
jgi:hypothetical protein